MTTGEGIATESEAKQKLGLTTNPSGYSPDRLITKRRVNSPFGGVVDDRTNTYTTNLCVRYKDILVKQTYNLHSDLVNPYTVTGGYTPAGNYRRDGIFKSFSGNTAQYLNLTHELFTLFYEYEGQPELTPYYGWDQSSIQFSGSNIDAGLVTISNCAEIKITSPQLYANNVINLSYPGDTGIFKIFQFRTLSQDWYQHINGLDIYNPNNIYDRSAALGQGTNLNCKNDHSTIYANMREGLKFTVIYLVNHNITDPIEIATFICQDVNATYKINNTYNPSPTELFTVTSVPLSNPNSTQLNIVYITDTKNKNLFQVIATKESAGGGQYYLSITFIKSPEEWEEGNLAGGYYISGLLLNATMNGVYEVIELDYSRFDTNGTHDTSYDYDWSSLNLTSSSSKYLGLDTSALYSLSLFHKQDLEVKEFWSKLLFVFGGLYITTDCCIVDPIILSGTGWTTNPIPLLYDNPKLPVDFEEVILKYTRAVETVDVEDLLSGASKGSFIKDNYLRARETFDHYNTEELLYFLFGGTWTEANAVEKVMEAIESGLDLEHQYFYDLLFYVGLGPGDKAWVAVSESVFFNANTNNKALISISEYPRAIDIENPYFGKIMKNIYSKGGLSEFMIYYKGHYYHYSIQNSLV